MYISTCRIICKYVNDKYVVQNTSQVTAVDQESGDVTFATVVVEVLPEGQSSKVALLHTRCWLLMYLNAEKSSLYVCLCAPQSLIVHYKMAVWQAAL